MGERSNYPCAPPKGPWCPWGLTPLSVCQSGWMGSCWHPSWCGRRTAGHCSHDCLKRWPRRCELWHRCFHLHSREHAGAANFHAEMFSRAQNWEIKRWLLTKFSCDWWTVPWTWSRDLVSGTAQPSLPVCDISEGQIPYLKMESNSYFTRWYNITLGDIYIHNLIHTCMYITLIHRILENASPYVPHSCGSSWQCWASAGRGRIWARLGQASWIPYRQRSQLPISWRAAELESGAPDLPTWFFPPSQHVSFLSLISECAHQRTREWPLRCPFTITCRVASAKGLHTYTYLVRGNQWWRPAPLGYCIFTSLKEVHNPPTKKV